MNERHSLVKSTPEAPITGYGLNVVQRGKESQPRRAPPRARRAVKPPEERRRNILDAALDLFAEHGFNETTVQDIAREAGVAAGTVYLYFPSKDHVLLALHRRLSEGLASQIERAAAETFEQCAAGKEVSYERVIDTVVDGLVAHSVANRRMIEVCTRYRPLIHADPQTEDKHLGTVVRILELGARLGIISTSDPEMTAYLLDAAISEPVVDHLTYGEPADLDRLIASTKELLRKALAPEPPAPPSPRRRSRQRR